MIKIKDPHMSPAIQIDSGLIDIDGALVLTSLKPIPPLEHNHAFFWMIETWLKNNEIPYSFDRTKEHYTSEDGMRLFGKEIDEQEWFIQNLQ